MTRGSMIDRRVRQLVPEVQDEGAQSRTFSDYLGATNLVLLGNPGAGKTYLLRNAADGTSKIYVTARNFLNTPAFPRSAQLLIDSLDERRAGRGDHTTIDQMVKKLFEIRPTRVCIACRAQDWLGETDLAAFRNYFGSTGGVVVVGLESLTAAEQVSVLDEKGHKDPEAFLAAAADRNLSDFLGNPQNLRMLSDVVQAGKWPETRKELFELSVRALLTEHNVEKSHLLDGSYTAEELLDAAGAACTVRLISDIDGICLANTELGADCPSFRSLGFIDIDKMRAALGRRAFASHSNDGRVDYAHRTVAEYLAAAWIAKLVNNGLPIGRVRALIGIDGRPASELRGLNAWLAVHLPSFAEQLISEDPYGVLTYGDPASLSPSGRRSLIKSLADLSVKDPWFRAGNWAVPDIGGLSSPETIDDFRAVLRSPSAASSLRSIVLDSLFQGVPQKALEGDLLDLVKDDHFDDYDRIRAAEVLARGGRDARAKLAAIYVGGLASNVKAVRLRAAIVSALYGDHFGPDDVAQLLADTFRCEEDLPGGSLWIVHKKVPTVDIPPLLSRYAQLVPPSEGREECENVWEISSALDRFLVRVLSDESIALDVGDVWRWLTARVNTDDRGIRRYADEERAALARRPTLLAALGEYGVRSFVAGDMWWRFLRRFGQMTAGTYDESKLVECIARRVAEPDVPEGVSAELYQMAFVILFGLNEQGVREGHFETLWQLADSRPVLQPLRMQSTRCVVEAWRIEDNARSAKWNEKKAARRKRNRQAVEENIQSIRSGEHLSLLGWCAERYFGRPDDTDGNSLESEIGRENFRAVCDGFLKLLERSADLSPESILEIERQGQYCRWWYALVAGMDDYWNRHQSVDKLSDSLLASLLVINAGYPTFVYDGNVQSQRDHAWKQWLFVHRPAFVLDIYLLIARSKLATGSAHVNGLYELLNHEAFASLRAQAAFDLLCEFPLAPTQYLEDMLLSILRSPGLKSAFVSLARRHLEDANANMDSDRYDLWLSAAYFGSPDEFRARLLERGQSRSEIVWRLRDLTEGSRRKPAKMSSDLSVGQLADIIRIASRHFKNVDHPRGWSGNTNPWDAAEYVRELISRLAANPSPQASTTLADLEGSPDLESYKDYLKHALAGQAVLYIDTAYEQPNWRQVVEALANRLPANVADLQALVFAHFNDLKESIAHSNVDLFKRFWNEDSYGKVELPKPEESCRDVLVELLRPRLQPLGILVEPEGHMARDKRADIIVMSGSMKIVIELKRDYHSEVWTAPEGQLDRLYVRDPNASGYGIYGVFWFGQRRPKKMPLPLGGALRPESPEDMEVALRDSLAAEKRMRIGVAVIDVSGVVH